MAETTYAQTQPARHMINMHFALQLLHVQHVHEACVTGFGDSLYRSRKDCFQPAVGAAE